MIKSSIFKFIKDYLDKLTEEQHMLDATRDQMSNAERRASTLRAELEELKALYERVIIEVFFLFFKRPSPILKAKNQFFIIFNETRHKFKN